MEKREQNTRYYSIQRPIGPGSFPTTQKVNNIVNFDQRELVPEIGREAWGYIEYDKPITEKEANSYELVPG